MDLWTTPGRQAFDLLPLREEMIMDERTTITPELDDADMREASLWAGAFLAGFKSVQTRRAYRRDLDCWFAFCLAHELHPFRGLRRTHLELYLRELEAQDTPPAPGTLYRRVSTLSSWFRWLEDEDVTIGNPAARIADRSVTTDRSRG
jgi:transposase-like protein